MEFVGHENIHDANFAHAPGILVETPNDFVIIDHHASGFEMQLRS